MGEYSCRCHGKRVISAPSKPLKLKLAGHILYGETRLRTKGFCSAPLRSRDIRDKVRNGILTLFRDQLYFSATKQRRTKSFGTHVHNTSNNTSTKLQLQRIKLHIEIINLKPVTPTTILLRNISIYIIYSISYTPLHSSVCLISWAVIPTLCAFL